MEERMAVSEERAGWPIGYPSVSYRVKLKAQARNASKGNATIT